MESFRGFTFNGDAATPARITPARKNSGSGQILADRSSSRRSNDENENPANPATPMPASLGARGKTGRTSLHSTQKAFIQAATCMKTVHHPSTPMVAPPPPSRGGQAAAASQLIVQNRHLQNRNGELEGLFHTSEKDNAQLKQRVREMEAQIAAQAKAVKEQRARADVADSAAAVALAETIKVKSDLEARTAEINRVHQAELAAARARAEAAKAEAARVLSKIQKALETATKSAAAAKTAEATTKRHKEAAKAAEAAAKTAEASEVRAQVDLRQARTAESKAKSAEAAAKFSDTRAQADLGRARAAEASARAAEAAAKSSETRAHTELGHLKSAEVRVRAADAKVKAAAAKSQERITEIRRRLASIAERVQSPTQSGSTVSVWAISGRKRGRGGTRGAVSGNQGGRGAGGSGQLLLSATAAPQPRGGDDDSKRAVFVEELCELIFFATGSKLGVDILEEFLSPTPLPPSSPSPPRPSVTSQMEKCSAADTPAAAVASEVAANARAALVESSAVTQANDAGTMPKSAPPGSVNRSSRSNRRRAIGFRNLEDDTELPRTQGERQMKRLQCARDPEQSNVDEARRESQVPEPEAPPIESKPPKLAAPASQKPQQQQEPQAPDVRKKVKKKLKANRMTPAEERAETSRMKKQAPNIGNISTTTDDATRMSFANEPRGSDGRSAQAGAGAAVAVEDSSAPRSPVDPADTSIAGECDDEFGVEEVPMPGGGGDWDDVMFSGDGKDEVGLITIGTPSKDGPGATKNGGESSPSCAYPSASGPLVPFVVGGQDLGGGAAESEGDVILDQAEKGKKKDSSKTTRRRSMRQMQRSAILFRQQQQQQATQDEEKTSSAARAKPTKTNAIVTLKPIEAAALGHTSDTDVLVTSNIENSEKKATAGKNDTVATADEVDTAQASPPGTKNASGPVRSLASPRRSPRRIVGGGAAIVFRALGEKGNRAVESVGVRARSKEDTCRGNAIAGKIEEAATATNGDDVGQAAAVMRPFGGDEAVRAVTAGNVERVAREMFGKVYLPGGALAGVLGAAWVLAEKCGSVQATGASTARRNSGTVVQQLESLLTAFVSAESCAITQGSDGATVTKTGSPPPKKRGKAGASGNLAPSVRRLRFCAFDLSSVEMPSDARKNSDAPAKEIVSSLERVVTQSDQLQRTLCSGGSGGGPTTAAGSIWVALLRGLRTLADANPVSAVVETVRNGCLTLGSQVSGKIVTRAAEFLLDELKPLQTMLQVPVQSPLRSRLASILSALVRFNLRRLLNPPPLSYTKPSEIMPFVAPVPSTDRSEVHKLMQLVPTESEGVKKTGAARDGAASAVLTMAMGKLHGYCESDAEKMVGGAEAFLSVKDILVTDNRNNKPRRKLPDAAVLEMLQRSSYRDVLEMLGTRAREARKYLVDTVDVMAALNARSFVLALLEHPGVEGAIARAGGWGDVEKFSSSLEKVKDFPDADAHLTLLSDMGALKAWLGREETWCSAGRDQRAENAFKRLDRLIVTCAENRSAVIKGIEDREAENARLAAITTNSSSGARGRDGRRSCVSSSRVTAAETAIARQGEKGLQGVVSGGGGGEEGAGVADGVRAGARESEAEQAIITSREASEIKGISLREAKELGQEALWQIDFPSVGAPRPARGEGEAGHDDFPPSSA